MKFRNEHKRRLLTGGLVAVLALNLSWERFFETESLDQSVVVPRVHQERSGSAPVTAEPAVYVEDVAARNAGRDDQRSRDQRTRAQRDREQRERDEAEADRRRRERQSREADKPRSDDWTTEQTLCNQRFNVHMMDVKAQDQTFVNITIKRQSTTEPCPTCTGPNKDIVATIPRNSTIEILRRDQTALNTVLLEVIRTQNGDFFNKTCSSTPAQGSTAGTNIEEQKRRCEVDGNGQPWSNTIGHVTCLINTRLPRLSEEAQATGSGDRRRAILSLLSSTIDTIKPLLETLPKDRFETGKSLATSLMSQIQSIGSSNGLNGTEIRSMREEIKTMIVKAEVDNRAEEQRERVADLKDRYKETLRECRRDFTACEELNDLAEEYNDLRVELRGEREDLTDRLRSAGLTASRARQAMAPFARFEKDMNSIQRDVNNWIVNGNRSSGSRMGGRNDFDDIRDRIDRGGRGYGSRAIGTRDGRGRYRDDYDDFGYDRNGRRISTRARGGYASDRYYQGDRLSLRPMSRRYDRYGGDMRSQDFFSRDSRSMRSSSRYDRDRYDRFDRGVYRASDSRSVMFDNRGRSTYRPRTSSMF